MFLLYVGLFSVLCTILANSFYKSLLHLIRFQTKYSILLVINSFFATLLAFLNLLFYKGSLGFLPASSMYLIFLLLAIVVLFKL